MQVLDAAELCRNVHPDLAFKESAEQVFHRLSALIHELNADEQVYAKIKEIDILCSQGRLARVRTNIQWQSFHVSLSLFWQAARRRLGSMPSSGYLWPT